MGEEELRGEGSDSWVGGQDSWELKVQGAEDLNSGPGGGGSWGPELPGEQKWRSYLGGGCCKFVPSHRGGPGGSKGDPSTWGSALHPCLGSGGMYWWYVKFPLGLGSLQRWEVLGDS